MITPLRFPEILLLLLGLMPLGPATAAGIVVAVAANFAALASELAAEFEAVSGTPVRIASGSSGALYAQIRNGAPFDVFLSADVDRPQGLQDAGLTHGDIFHYAQGILAVYAPRWELSDDLPGNLGSPRIKVLALANARTAPYGAAAEAVLDALEARGAMLPARRAVGGSIGQAFQYVQTGNADMGFVALSQIRALLPPVDAAHVQIVPQSLYPPVQQAGVILKRTHQLEPAAAWVAFLQTESTRARLQEAGYAVREL